MTSGKTSVYAKNYTEFLNNAAILMEQDNHELKYAVMYMDITGFQSVNDFYGFSEGDRFLKSLFQMLAGLRGTRVCARVFSDHFLCFSEFHKDEHIGELTKFFKDEFDRFLTQQSVYHKNCKVHLSCGYCVAEVGAIVHAIDDANMARKEAKAFPHTTIIWFDDIMRKKIKKHKDMEISIQEALQKNEFIFFLQPKVNLNTGKIVAAEALARWIRKDGSMVYPDEFIPLMEQNETITELDFQIYEKVCKYLHDCLSEGKTVVPISVNMSRVDIHIPDVTKKIHKIAGYYEIPPYLLDFELTETVLMDEFDCAKEFMDSLRSYGYKTSIDDFGAGFTGVNIWRELNFDVVKLDKNFITEDQRKMQKNDIIVSSISYVGKNLETSLLCEGVETYEQCRHMKSLGCDIGQGYCFSRPVSIEKFEESLKKNNGYFPLPWNGDHAKCRSTEYLESQDVTLGQMRGITPSLLRIMPCGMAGFDEMTGGLIFISDKLLAIFGYTREEYLKEKNEDWTRRLFPENPVPSIRARHQNEFKDIGHLYLNYSVRKKDGGQIYITLYLARVSTPEYGTYVLGCFYDETMHKNTLNFASKLEKKFDFLVHAFHGTLATVVLNDNMRIKEAAEEYYQMLGYTKREFMEEPVYGYAGNLIDADEMVKLKKALEQVLLGKEDYAEFCIHKKDGKKAWHAAYISDLYQERDELHAHVVFVDISYYKNLEAQNEHIFNFYQEIYDTAACGIIQFREEIGKKDAYQIISANDYAAKLYGFQDKKEFLESNKDLINSFVLPEDISLGALKLEKLKKPGDAVLVDFRIKRQDMQTRYITGTLKLLQGQNEEQIYLAVFVDSSSRVEMDDIKSRLKTVVENTPGDVAVAKIGEEDFEINYLSVGLMGTFGYSKNEFHSILSKHNGMGLVHKNDVWQVMQTIHKCASEKKPIDINFRALYKSGKIGWHNFSASYYRQEEGRAVYHGIITDVTKLKEQEEALIRSDRRYRMVAQLVGVDIWSYNFKTGVLNVPLTEQMAGLMLRGKTDFTLEEFLHFIHPKYHEAYKRMYERIRQGEDQVHVDVPALMADGKYQWFRLKCRVSARENDMPLEITGIATNINDEKLRQNSFRELQQKAMRDALTKCYNREAAKNLIRERLMDWDPAEGIDAFMIIDIDNFKNINDRFGHQEGDRVLVELSRGIETILTQDCILGRLGGDEFMLYIPRAMYESDIYSMAKDICEQADLIRPNEGGNGVTVSIGIALVEVGMEFSDLYNRADKAMYQIKNRNKNGYGVYNEG